MDGRFNLIRGTALAGLAMLVFIGPSAVWGQAIGDCLTVEVPAPIVLPDGSTHPAGSLRICMSRTFSPVSCLHETYVDGIPVGLLKSRRGTSEDEAEDQPYVLFQRTDRGELLLLGYAWPGRGTMATYRLADPTVPKKQLAKRTRNREAPFSAHVGNDTMVLLTASTK